MESSLNSRSALWMRYSCDARASSHGLTPRRTPRQQHGQCTLPPLSPRGSPPCSSRPRLSSPPSHPPAACTSHLQDAPHHLLIQMRQRGQGVDGDAARLLLLEVDVRWLAVQPGDEGRVVGSAELRSPAERRRLGSRRRPSAGSRNPPALVPGPAVSQPSAPPTDTRTHLMPTDSSSRVRISRW